MFLRSHHRCRWILDPRHIRKSEMLAAWHVTMYPSSNMLQCGNEPQIWRENKIFLQRCACPPSCFREPMEYAQNIDLHLVSDFWCTYVYDNPYKTEPNSSGSVPTKFRHAAASNHFPSLSAALTVQQWRRRDIPAFHLLMTSWFQGHMSMVNSVNTPNPGTSLTLV